MSKKGKWVTEPYTTKDGKVYQRYSLDKNGNKIPREPIVEDKREEGSFKELKSSITEVVLVEEEGSSYYKEIHSSNKVEELIGTEKKLSHRQQLQREVENNRGK
jgi:hypothetical protein